MENKVLIVSVSAGAGHVRAAAALERAFAVGGYPGSVRTVDLLDYMSVVYRGFYLRAYYSIISRLPSYWRFLYKQWDRKPSGGLQRHAVLIFDRLSAKRFLRLLDEEKFTHVICTHFLPAEITAWLRRKGRLAAPAGVVITDYDAHRIWINDGTDRYFIATDALRDQLERKGVPLDRVTATGIPIDPVFVEPMDKAVARAELGLDAALPTVLVAAGAGTGGAKETIDALVGTRRPMQILAVTRHDAALKQSLEAMSLPAGVRLAAYGFIDFMHKLMAAADVIVTKPGGMSTTESLACGLPMILSVPIPGQEEMNSAYLVEHGAAVVAGTADAARDAVVGLLDEPARLDRMRQAALAIARPRAAFDILDAMLGPRDAAGH